MPKVTYVQPTGAEIELDVSIGDSLMSAATKANVAGIIGDCGGNLVCATCHVSVEAPHLERLAPPGDQERNMLDFTVTPAGDASRLCCQIKMTQDLDGIRVLIPEAQE